MCLFTLLASVARSSVPGNKFKVLMMQRSKSSGFMPSTYVFPGGVLDPADANESWVSNASLATSAGSGPFPIEPLKKDSLALRVCALRELFEETGLLLARPTKETSSSLPFLSSAHAFSSLSVQREFQASVSADGSTFERVLASEGVVSEPLKLAPWSRWITPTFEKRRYDTYFYLTALPAPFTSLTGDAKEVSAASWLSPCEALELARTKKIVLPPPTTYILRELEHMDTLEQVFEQSEHETSEEWGATRMEEAHARANH